MNIMLKKIISTAILGVALLLTNTNHVEAAAYASQQWELEKKADNYQYWVNKAGISQDTQVNQKVATIFGKLLATVPESRWSQYYTVRVTNAGGVNAFTTPGANIFITPDLVKMVSSNDEVAFVLAHEMGHQEGEHFLDTAKKKQEMAVVGGIVQILSKGKVSDNTLNIIGQELTYNVFGRDHEHDADKRAFEYVLKTGYNPASGAIFFSRMNRKFGDKPTGFGDVVSSLLKPEAHEPNQYRINNQIKYLKEASNNRIEINLEKHEVLLDGKPYSSIERMAEIQHLDKSKYTQEEATLKLAGYVVKAVYNGKL